MSQRKYIIPNLLYLNKLLLIIDLDLPETSQETNLTFLNAQILYKIYSNLQHFILIHFLFVCGPEI